MGLTVAVSDGVVDVRIESGEGNLLSMAMCAELTALLRDPPAGAHVLRLRAAGPHFCLGRERAASRVGDVRDEVATLVALNDALPAGPLVTLAEVAGDASGFGVGLAALCHFTVAGPTCRFSFPEVTMGLAPTVVLAWLPSVVGWKEAFRLTATGDWIDADEARALGLVTRVAHDPARAVDELVTELRGLPPTTHAEIAEFLRLTRSGGSALSHGLAIERLVTGSLGLESQADHSADE